MPAAVTDWGMATWTGLTAGLVGFYAYMPRVVGAALILLVGWAVAGILAVVAERFLVAVRFDAAVARLGVDDAVNRAGVRLDPTELVVSLVRWAAVLVAFMMAADTLALPRVSAGIAAVLGYIPNVIAAAAILGLGLALAGLASRLVRGAAGAAGVRTGDLLGDLAFWAIAIFASLGAIEQLDIAPNLVQTLYTAVVGAVALAAALAFGLGLRDQARDLVAGHALADHLHEGDEITLEHVRGRVQRVGAVKTLIQTGEGLMSVPNRQLADQVFRVVGHRLAVSGGGGGAVPERAKPVEPIAPSWTVRPGEDELPSI